MEALAADGHTLAGLDLAGPPPDTGLDSHDVEFIRADVRDTDAVAAALPGVDVVCHQAAMVGLGTSFADTPEYVGRNDFGTAVLLSQMADEGVRRLVLASSMVIYGEGRYECQVHGEVRAGPRAVDDLAAGQFEPCCPDCAEPLRPGLVGEDTPPDPRNVYAVTKLAQEGLASSWARATGGVAAAMRYHNVYGPRMPRDTPYAGVAAIFRSALGRGEAPRVFEDGGQLRDFVHVRDVARANAAAARWACAQPDGTFRAFNVGSGTPRSVGELARGLSEVLAGPAPEVTGEYRLGDVRHIVASSERLRSELDWGPSVSFADGLAEFAGSVRLNLPAGQSV